MPLPPLQGDMDIKTLKQQWATLVLMYQWNMSKFTQEKYDTVKKLGLYSPSQNGVIVSPNGICPCVSGGGRGHDIDRPKILIEY